MAFTFQFIALYLVDLPTNWFAFVLFVWLLLSVLCDFFFFSEIVNSARTFVPGQCKYVQLIQTTVDKKSKQNQRFKSIYVLFVCSYKRDDALNILLLDKKETFCSLILIQNAFLHRKIDPFQSPFARKRKRKNTQ